MQDHTGPLATLDARQLGVGRVCSVKFPSNLQPSRCVTAAAAWVLCLVPVASSSHPAAGP